MKCATETTYRDGGNEPVFHECVMDSDHGGRLHTCKCGYTWATREKTSVDEYQNGGLVLNFVVNEMQINALYLMLVSNMQAQGRMFQTYLADGRMTISEAHAGIFIGRETNMTFIKQIDAQFPEVAERSEEIKQAVKDLGFDT